MEYLPRLVDRALSDALTTAPAVLLTGPRACGKTTSARRLAADWVRLDEPRSAAAFVADPDAALRARHSRPLLLDEWQAAPGLAGALKRAVDDDPEPGSYLLTGSVSAELERGAWPLTGRVVRIPMYGLTMRERQGHVNAESFVSRIASHEVSRLQPRGPHLDLGDYVNAALQGGFPPAVALPNEAARERWLSSYVDQLTTADVAGADAARNPSSLRRYLEASAASTAGAPEHKSVYDAAGVTRTTGVAYDAVLSRLHAIELVPAWHTNRLKRLTKAPKRHLVDPGLAAALLGADLDLILRDGDLLGRLLDTFVYSQLRPELALDRQRGYHLRTEGGRQEIDIVVDLGAAGVIGIEVKATAAPGPSDARHLAWLRDELGERFVAGAVLHTGPDAFALGAKLFAVPIRSLWQVL